MDKLKFISNFSFSNIGNLVLYNCSKLGTSIRYKTCISFFAIIKVHINLHTFSKR